MFARSFAISWIAYFGYYLCRKNLSVLMPYLKSEAGLSSNDLASAVFGYSLMYSAGQLAMGRLADRIGARWVAGIGMLISALMSSLMAWPAWIGSAGILIAIQSVNGFSQASGWPSVLKLARDWFPSGNRGVWMGWWSTHMVLGGFAGTWLAAYCAEADWTRAAWVPSLILGAIAVLWMTMARDGESKAAHPSMRGKLQITPALLAIAGMYFCIKLTRYAYLFWLPLYMTEKLSYAKPEAGYASSIFEVVGVLGALGAGYASERLNGARFGVGGMMMFGLAVLCATYPAMSAMGYVPNLIWIALIGAFTFGPDTLMAGAALQDAVPPESMASAGGFVNGVGSLGQVISPWAVAYLSQNYGWTSLFALLSVVVMCGGAALATQWAWFQKQKQEVVPE